MYLPKQERWRYFTVALDKKQIQSTFFKDFIQTTVEKIANLIPDTQIKNQVLQKIKEHKQTLLLLKKIHETEKMLRELE